MERVQDELSEVGEAASLRSSRQPYGRAMMRLATLSRAAPNM